MRFCPNCGTEVDDSAFFCPTCGQAVDQAAETEIPAAPTWPDPEPAPEPPVAEPPPPPSPTWHAGDPPADAWDTPEPWDSGMDAAGLDATPDRAEPSPPVAPAAPVPPAESSPAPTDGGKAAAGGAVANVPLTLPVTLSGWLIGVGAAVGALGALIGLFDGAPSIIELLMLVTLLMISGTVFFATLLPPVPHLRLATLVIAAIGFGAAFDRIGVGGGGIGVLLLFLGTAAAAIGAILLELGRDEPLGRG